MGACLPISYICEGMRRCLDHVILFASVTCKIDSGFLLVLEVARVSGNLERKSLRVSPVRD